MKKLFVPFLFLIALGCTTNLGDKYNANKMDPKELDANLWSIMRYVARSPEGLTPPERFYPAYDSHYVAQMKLFIVEAWYQKGGVDYFMVSRRAPSLMDKRVATGGKIVYNNDGGITEYEEVFRTWKMVPDTLKKRSLFLFDKMVNGEPLQHYETRFSNGVEYIEFPDERNFYDKQERAWKFKAD